MSIGPEVLNLVRKNWLLGESMRLGKERERTQERTNLTLHISSAGTDFSLLAPGSLCTPQMCLVMLCMVHCFYLGTNSSLTKWLRGYSLGFRNPKVCAFILLLSLSFNGR